MSITNSKGKLTDIFKDFFTEGSDGKPVAGRPIVKPAINESLAEKKIFKGYLKIKSGYFILEIPYGGTFSVIFKTPTNAANNNSELVTLQGIQVEDRIEDAVLINLKASSTAESLSTRLIKKSQFTELATATKKFLKEFQSTAVNLLTARPGYKYIEGEITKIPAILAIVDKKINKASLDSAQILPEKFLNFDVEVVEASPKDYLVYKHNSFDKSEAATTLPNWEPSILEAMVLDEVHSEAAILEARELTVGYVPPPHVQLDEVTAPMTLVCHVSPEGGWKTLGPFLEDTNDHLQVAMYDFTAPHLFEKMKSVLKQGASLKMVYDDKKATKLGKPGNKLNDIHEEVMINSWKKIAKDRFEFIGAWKGKAGICNNAYHIKVAVRDKKSFWLSSGNWQSSNQPNLDFSEDPKLTTGYNREWNIIVSNDKLSDIFYKFIDWDFEKSQEKPESALLEMDLPDIFVAKDELEDAELNRLRLFPPQKFVFTRTKPVKIQPILSPDNYVQHALALLKSATNKIYFQNQYIKLTEKLTPEYEELLTLLRDATLNSKIDCRIILRTPFSTADKMSMFNDLQASEFDMSKVRLMNNTHTKGIIVDGERIMLGSHNWSSSGVQFNRDASLLIYDDGVAKYYEDVFLHDWERRTGKREREESFLIGTPGTENALLDADFVKLDWEEYFS